MRLLLLLLLYLSACRDQDALPLDECDASRIAGRWRGAFSPKWHYEFREPHLWQWITVGGDTVTRQHYLYATDADTLWASGPGGERMWILCFPDDSTCQMRQWDVWKWSPVRTLRRE